MEAPARHKAVILDLGRVLVHFEFKRAYETFAAHCSCPASEIPVRLATTDLVRQLETGRLSGREFHAEFVKFFGMDLDYGVFCQTWTSIFMHELLPESLIEDLARRYRLVLLSNTNEIHFGMIRAAYPHIRHFHHLVLSYKVGAMKPEQAIYRAAIERAGCRPEECFYADDIAEFVEGGRRAGMDAVQFQSHDQLERELRARGCTAR